MKWNFFLRPQINELMYDIMDSLKTDATVLGTLEEKLFHACSRGDIENVRHYLDKGANMNTICSTGRTPFGVAAQLGNLAIIKAFLDYCNVKDKRRQSLKVSHSKSKRNLDVTTESEEKSKIGNFVISRDGNDCVDSSLSDTNVKEDENLNNFQGVCCTCSKMDEVCLGKSCDHCNSLMSALNETTYNLACFNDAFVRRDPRFKSKSNSNELDILLDDEVRTPDGMNDLEWDMEIRGSKGLAIENDDVDDDDDPSSALYIWYAAILSQTSSLLEEKPPPLDIDREDQFGRSALHYAVMEGHIDAIRLLINSGCKVNVVDLGNLTPLHLAASKDVPEVVELLIDAGADIHHKTIDKISPLHVSASRGFLSIVRLLVEAGAHLNTLDSSDRTPLFMAVSRCHAEVVSYLINQGAQVNLEEIHGYNPLYEAVSQKNTEIVKMLLAAGAKITQSHYLLHSAVLHRHEEMVRLLILAGSVINLRDEFGDTPLITAAKTQQPKIARILLENGASIHATNFLTGTTALHVAIENNSWPQVFEEMIDLFLEFNVNLEIESGQGGTLLLSALTRHRFEVAAILIRHGASTNGRQRYWMYENLFEFVIDHGTLLLIKLFVYSGCNFRSVKIDKNVTDVRDKWVLQAQRNPLKLCDLCRIQVRNQFKSKVYEKVDALPIPPSIKSYLKLEDVY